ncbi:hypothetical protein H6G33_04320 [Calothrix sp. FACHB-1219]|uniref:hypothetical protein n=1 Tax=unclassified Calothrix TaxID=2619626 RepID=UPI001682CF50|nr:MULTISPECIES: hypothetical protein [unclassified Calothrix]MBD2204921.1 hypothetical protein [Calothrix sp. FACHB-168]MBD2216254.1 hypothetical protein [Calothrix sp. FACHB-1219]
MTTANSRPVAITVICIIGFVGLIPSFLLIFSPVAAGIGAWYPPFLALASVGGLISFIGMWLMKKWGVYAYIGLTMMSQIVLITKGVWNPLALLIPLIAIAIGWTNLKNMS